MQPNLDSDGRMEGAGRMTATNRALPSFRKPPLTEVALAIQWEPLPNIGVHHLGLLWQQFRDRFPTVQHQGELSPMMERAGTSGAMNEPQIQFARAPVPRLWFLDTNERELLQIQRDRFARNWRKIQTGDVYPRYENHIRPSFESDFNTVVQFFRDQRLGELAPNQCEVVYVNHIEPAAPWSTHAELGQIFSSGIALPALSCGAKPEQGQFELVYSLSNEDDEFAGRLRVSCTPGTRQADGAPIYQVRLAARGWPIGPDIAGALKFLDFGREKIVRTFAEITSTEMHKVWEREDG